MNIYSVCIYMCMCSISRSGILDVIHTPRHDITAISSLLPTSTSFLPFSTNSDHLYLASTTGPGYSLVQSISP